MGKKEFLFLIGLLSGFLLLVSLSGVISAQGVNCSDRGEFCGTIPRLLETFECCAGVCTTSGNCLCLDDCCSLTSSLGGNRSDTCYCEGECRSALTCISGTCCDDRTDWKRDAGVACYCDVECKSGQCVGGVCFDPAADTCSPAGCNCIDTDKNCEIILGGEVNYSLICPDPSLDVCCCPLVPPPPPPPPGSCDSPCSCQLDCYGLIAGTCEDGIRLCCCPRPGPSPAVCGNGVVEAGEQCDDGNIVSGDGCSSSCISEGANGNGNGGGSWPIGGNGGIIDLKSPLGCTTIEECIGRMINFLFSLSVILTPLMIIIAGFLYITAAGKPEKIVQAQKLITWTLIGFLIVSLSRAIIYVITSVIGG